MIRIRDNQTEGEEASDDQNRAIRSGSRSRSRSSMTVPKPSATRTTGADRIIESGVMGDSCVGGYLL